MKAVILKLGFRIFELIYIFVCFILIVYFLLASFKGEYGLFKKYQLIAQEKTLIIDLKHLSTTKDALKNKTQRLSTSSLDLELLDEQARSILGMIGEKEVIIY